jgi:hypothetical protein
MANKKTTKFICLCLECGKSSNAGNKCLYEEKEKMAACPTYIRIKKVGQPKKK